MGKEESAAVSVSVSKSNFPSPKTAPWLVIPYGKGTAQNQAFYNICEPNNKTCRKSIPELIGKRYVQKPSHQGWLIIFCDDKNYDYSPDNYKFGDCFLWNPATLETICLPSLSKWCGGKSSGYYFLDCVLSSPPSGDGGGDSMVLFVFTDANKGNCNLAFLYCYPRDKKWKTNKWYSQSTTAEDMQSLHCFKGKFYIMCSEFDWNIEIEKQRRSDGTVKLCIRNIEVIGYFSYPLIGGLHTCFEMTKFVATDDQLYYIPLTYYDQRGFGKVVIQIRVMRLDLSAMAWKMVYNIGDNVLFLGSGNTTACCSAAEMGLAKGCAYFTLPRDQCLYKFDIESSGNSFVLPCLDLPNPWKDPDFIMIFSGRKRKREENIVGKDACKKNLANAVGCKTDVVHDHEDGKQVGIENAGDFAEMKAYPWDILNGDMVESIANSLHRLDYIHLRSVCKAHRELLPTAKFTSTRGSTHLSPWMMFSRDHCRTTFNFLNPMHNNENYLLNLSDLVRTVIRFQKGGWLLVSKENMERRLFFINPFTRETIKLPELPVDFTFSSVSFSSLPTSPDCIVVAIELQSYDDEEVVRLYFIRKGEEFWSSRYFGAANIENYMPSHNTPAFYRGGFYFADYNGSLGVFNIENNSWKVLEEPYQPFSDIYPSFLLECDGKLLLVKLGRHGTLFGIYRLERYWVKVKNLGKHMLFVSHTSCFSAIAPNSQMANKVYFPRLCMNGEGVLFYCLETGTYRSFKNRHSASNFTDTEGWYSNCTWIEPNWSKSDAQELEWV